MKPQVNFWESRETEALRGNETPSMENQQWERSVVKFCSMRENARVLWYSYDSENLYWAEKELFYTQCGSYRGENIAIIYEILKYYLLTTFNSMIF